VACAFAFVYWLLNCSILRPYPPDCACKFINHLRCRNARYRFPLPGAHVLDTDIGRVFVTQPSPRSSILKRCLVIEQLRCNLLGTGVPDPTETKLGLYKRNGNCLKKQNKNIKSTGRKIGLAKRKRNCKNKKSMPGKLITTRFCRRPGVPFSR
jgi:hypothetical protein